MKKILLFTDILGSGGAQRQLTTLAFLLKKRGFDILMLDYWDSDFYDNYLNENGIPFKHIPTKGKWNIIKMFVRESNMFKPDVVISYMENPSVVACAGKYLCKKKFKLIVSERNTTQIITGATKLRMNLFRTADRVVPNSISQGAFINEHYPFLRKKVRVIRNVIDIKKFSLPDTKIESNKLKRILVVARVVEQKNVVRFIEAIKIIKNLIK